MSRSRFHRSGPRTYVVHRCATLGLLLVAAGCARQKFDPALSPDELPHRDLAARSLYPVDVGVQGEDSRPREPLVALPPVAELTPREKALLDDADKGYDPLEFYQPPSKAPVDSFSRGLSVGYDRSRNLTATSPRTAGVSGVSGLRSQVLAVDPARASIAGRGGAAARSAGVGQGRGVSVGYDRAARRAAPDPTQP